MPNKASICGLYHEHPDILYRTAHTLVWDVTILSCVSPEHRQQSRLHEMLCNIYTPQTKHKNICHPALSKTETEMKSTRKKCTCIKQQNIHTTQPKQAQDKHAMVNYMQFKRASIHVAQYGIYVAINVHVT